MTNAAVDQVESRDIVVIGASAGGVETLQRLVAALPPALPFAFFVVLHIAPHSSHMPEILSRAGSYEAVHPEDGDAPPYGGIVVAPPNLHLIVEEGVIRLRSGERYGGARPAVDPLFETAAAEFGPRVVGIVLSGGLHDGAAGLAAVMAHGGLGVVQDPDEAAHRSMPDAAIAACPEAKVLPIAEIATFLGALASSQSLA
ncbi:MAG: two-component system, chemotaxis family, protein-glutamate methylesterase/glutaminase [Gaiellaceae bacterium]|jgi:two-component system chemotaxis response regulator CheB|nr:two-component system, chemotaxis family, protein-glutamate methylesterase/glutaminase [Gaiellaceae bacterium]